MKRNLLFCFLLISCIAFSKAQFYDGEDEIVFYAKKGSESNPNIYVFNFDGRTAAQLDQRYKSGIVKYLKNNPNYYEDKVSSARYDLKYDDDKSGYSTEVYKKYISPGYGLPGGYKIYTFSSDREELEIKDTATGNKYKFIRVPKEFFIPQNGRSSKLKEDVIYE